MKALLLTLPVLAMLGETSAANACTTNNTKNAREEIKQSDDVFFVRGQFTTEGQMQRTDDPYENYRIVGELDAVGDLSRKVWLEYNDTFVMCGIQFAPPTDANGRFWLSRAKTDGRHQTILWEGVYTEEGLAKARAHNEALERETAKESAE